MRLARKALVIAVSAVMVGAAAWVSRDREIDAEIAEIQREVMLHGAGSEQDEREQDGSE